MTDPFSALTDRPLEHEVLGVILGFGLWSAYAAVDLVAEDFSLPACQWIFNAAGDVHDDGGVAELPAISLRLRALGRLEEVGPAFLGSLVTGAVRPSPATILAQVARLKELRAGRDAWHLAKNLQGELRAPGAVADGALARHIDHLQAVIEQAQATTAPRWLDIDAQLAAHARDMQTSRGARTYLGLPLVDENIGGVSAGEVAAYIARPGIGKTVLLCRSARAVSENDGHVLVSLEMPGSQIVGRFKQIVYGVGRYELERAQRFHQLDDELYRRTFRNLVIVDTPGLSIAEIGRLVRQIQAGPLRDIPIRRVTIDHLGLVGGDRGLRTYDRVSTQAREIKELAKRLDVAVLLAVQVNREAGGDGSSELHLGSARDSGVVEEAMDYIVAIRRLDRSVTLSQVERDKYRDVLFLKVIKNRHGDPMYREVAYRFSPVGLTLTEDRDLQPNSDNLEQIAQPRRWRGGGAR